MLKHHIHTHITSTCYMQSLLKDTEDYKTYKSDVNSELMKTDPKVLPRNNPAFEQLRQKIESSSRQVTDIQVIAGIRKDLCTKYAGT
jgi:hypothetical protein